MANTVEILTILVPIISLIVGTLVALYPNRVKTLFTSIHLKFITFKKRFLTLKQSVNYTNIFLGILIIAFVPLFNESSNLINQDTTDHTGTTSICPSSPNYNCYFPISGNYGAFFKINIKADSINKLILVYSSEKDQILEIGIGNFGKYTTFSKQLVSTAGTFKEEEFFAGKDDTTLCKDCFNDTISRFFGSVFSTQRFIVIKPTDDIKLNALVFKSEGTTLNFHRFLAIIIGVIYIIIGFVLVNKNKKGKVQ